jgi:hypothetical protein
MFPAVIEGSTVRVAESAGLHPSDLKTFNTADELAGAVHYWLTVPVDGQKYIVDIASDGYGSVGEIIVSDSLPDDYYQYPDSQTNGMELLEHVQQRGNRCQRCGDHRYTPGGCSVCVETISPDLR